MTKQTHNFGEKEIENGVKVWLAPTFITSRNKAIEMIDNGKYGLCDSDFWILKNKMRNGGIAYTSLIISHNGCLKVNSRLPEDKRFMSKYLGQPEPSPFDDAIIITYDDGEMREYGEVSKTNCKNDYPMAMLLKRVMDRVILKKSELAFSGIYSEVESDNFSQNAVENETVSKSQTQETVTVNPDTGEVTTASEATPVQKQEAAPVQGMSEKQLNLILDLKKRLDITDELMKTHIKTITGKDKLRECSKAEASALITFFQGEKNKATA